MSTPCIIGIDIGGTNFRIGAVDGKNQVSRFRKIPTGTVFCTTDGLKDLEMYLKEYMETLSEDGMAPRALAVGFPATLNRERTMVLQAPNVAFMENLPVPEVLSKALGIPVYIERDVTMALLYDRAKYGLEDCEILTGCYFGTGVGNALMIYGRMLTGKDGTAGELGHIPVDGNELRCGCGNTGCMETVAGGRYLAYLSREVYPDTPVGELFEKRGQDPLLRRFVDRMAMAAATEINILNPDCMIIGGGVPRMKCFPTEYLLERILFYTRKPFPAENLRLVFAEDEEDKSVAGAAIYARERMKE